MRTWTRSACVVLAWSILPVILVAAGPKGSVTLAQANTRTSSTSTRITSSTEIVFTSTLSVAAAPVTATSHTTKYVVKDGDTLAGIATRFAVRGGWPALYAANRRAIGPDPNIVHAGTVLTLPAPAAPSPPATAPSPPQPGPTRRQHPRPPQPSSRATAPPHPRRRAQTSRTSSSPIMTGWS